MQYRLIQLTVSISYRDPDNYFANNRAAQITLATIDDKLSSVCDWYQLMELQSLRLKLMTNLKKHSDGFQVVDLSDSTEF